MCGWLAASDTFWLCPCAACYMCRCPVQQHGSSRGWFAQQTGRLVAVSHPQGKAVTWQRSAAEQSYRMNQQELAALERWGRVPGAASGITPAWWTVRMYVENAIAL
jgi:hypothetical protein